MALPITLSIKNDWSISLDRFNSDDGFILSLPFSSLILLIIIATFFNIKHLYLSVAVFTISIIFLYFFSYDLKSLAFLFTLFLIFYLLLSDENLRHYCINIPHQWAKYTIFFQIIILFNEYLLDQEYGSLIFDFVKVYDYEQYFTFNTFLAFLLLFKFNNFLLNLFYFLVVLFSALDSSNTTALFCIIYFIILLFSINLFTYSKKILLFIVEFNIISIIFIPVVLAIINNFYDPGEIFINLGLTARMQKHGWHLFNLNCETLLLPWKLLYFTDGNEIHNQFFQWVQFLGFPFSLLLLLLFINAIKFQTGNYLKVGFSIYIGIAGALTEVITHPGTGWIFLFFLFLPISINHFFKHSD